MRELERPIGRVFLRLRVQRFLAAFVWAIAGFLLVATIVVGVDRLAVAFLPFATWVPYAIAGGLALTTAIVVACATGPSRVDAAVAIDRAFALNERLSTSLTLPEEMKQTAAGRALMADTIKHVADLDVADRFGLKLPRRSWLPLIPGAMAGVLLFAPEWAASVVKAKTTSTEPKVDVKLVSKNTQILKERMAAQRKEMSAKGKFAEADKLLAEIEKKAAEMAKAPPAEKDKSLLAMNKLSDSINERKKQLGTPEQVKRQLEQMKSNPAGAENGPADQFMKDLQKGNFDKAANDLKQLKDKLESGKMSQAEKKQLQNQLNQLSKQLKDAANMEKQKEQLEKAMQNGGLSKEQFDKAMAKLDDQKKQLESLKKIADQLAEAGQKMNQGDMKKAAEQLGMTQKQMEELGNQLKELQALDGAMADLQDAKDGMTGGDQMNKLGDDLGMGGRSKNAMERGNGGQGRGAGDRPEAPDDTAMYSSRLKGQLQRGKAVLEGSAPSQGVFKGASKISMKAEIATSSGNAADALTNQKVPRSVEKHVSSYYDAINKN